MEKSVYEHVREFKNKYPFTVSWRLKSHCKVLEKHLNPGEKIKFAFAAQKGASDFDIITTYVVVLTETRLLLAQKRMLFGYFFTSITPDLFNDFKIKMGILWGDIYIDTLKELVILSNIQKSALPEIEQHITSHMLKEKQKYKNDEKKME